jgi:hypothetical protein
MRVEMDELHDFPEARSSAMAIGNLKPVKVEVSSIYLHSGNAKG